MVFITEALRILDHACRIVSNLYLTPLACAGGIAGEVAMRKNIRWTGLDRSLAAVVDLNVIVIAILALAYLAYPTYLTHVEATVASLGAIFRQGGQIYPSLSDYSYHGLLYGPGFSELQAFIQSFGLPVILASKIPGVAALLMALVLCKRLYKDGFARAYLLLLIPFGCYLFWDRAEPIFILLVIVSLLILRHRRNLASALAVGCIAGLVSCLKPHAVLYIAAATIVVWRHDIWSVARMLAIMAGLLITLLLVFSPVQVSAVGYLSYLELAGKHGISPLDLLKELFFLAVLIAPVAYLGLYEGAGPRGAKALLWLLLLIELVVAIIGAKPGAGPHHLIPFIPVNAYLCTSLLAAHPRLNSSLVPYKFALLVVGLGGLYLSLTMAWRAADGFSLQRQLKAEVVAIGNKYPGVVLGASDTAHYSYVFLRAILEAKGYRQIDYAAFMDLSFSGVPDDGLYLALLSCRLPYIALPISGVPFSTESYYTDRPLFSDHVRAAFERDYQLLDKTNDFRIYECKKK